MKKMILVIMCLSILISGCSSEIIKYDYETDADFIVRINEICKGQEKITVEMKDGKIYMGKFLEINVNSVSLHDKETKELLLLKKNQVSTISFNEKGEHKTQSMFYGIWVGLGLAVINHLIYPLVPVYYGYLFAPVLMGSFGIILNTSTGYQTIVKIN